MDGTGREEGSGWGTCVYLWRIHVDNRQNQYNIVKLKNKIKLKKKNVYKIEKKTKITDNSQNTIRKSTYGKYFNFTSNT